MQQFKKVRTELIVLSVLVPLVIILGALLIKWPHLQDPGVENTATNEPLEKLPEAMPSISAVPKISPPAISTPPAEQNFEEVTLTTEKNGQQQSWQVAVKQVTTVEKVLEVANNKGYLEVKTTDYGGSMGVFIESLGGIANNNIEKIYWHLYINDVLSPVGATQATVKAGDSIIWKYEKQHDEN